MACPALVYPQPAMYLPRSHLVGHSPFSHLSHPNSNPKSNPICNLILTLILTLTNPNLNSNPTLTLTLTLRRVTKVGRWTRAHLKPATSCHELKPYNDAISCPVFSANLKFRKKTYKISNCYSKSNSIKCAVLKMNNKRSSSTYTATGVEYNCQSKII